MVVNWNVDLLLADDFVSRIVELSNIRVLQALLSCHSLVRVED